jgi:PPP family 3-phenylpropionic acid transporter
MLGGLLSGYTWEGIGPAWTYTIGAGFALAGLLWLSLGWKGEPGAAHALHEERR